MGKYFDIRTLSFVAGVTGLILAALMVHVSYHRKTYPGFARWTASAIAMALGLILLSLRDFVPAFVTVLIANSLIVVAVALMASGLGAFAGIPRSTWLVLIPVACVLGPFVYLTYYYPSVSYRIVIISVIVGLLFWYGGYLCSMKVSRMLTPRLRRTGAFLTVVFGILGAWYLARAVLTALAGNAILDFMQASAYQGLAILFLMAGNIGIFVGLIVLSSERLAVDLEKAIGEVKNLRGLLPICASCKKIRTDDGGWQQLEVYIHEHSEADFSHGVCPECASKDWGQQA